MKSSTAFHHKVLRAILKLSKHSPVVPLYFLLGELPVETSLHLDVLSLFWNAWCNPQTKANQVIKYILKMSDNSSVTWSAHLRVIFLLYSLPDPLMLLNSPPWSKARWKQHTMAAVTSHHERLLRLRAASNIKLQYLNVQVTGLSGRPHPILSWIQTTRDVTTVRPHLRMLAGDYPCYSYLAHDRGVPPHCRLCTRPTSPTPQHQPEEEGMTHILTRCSATRDTRQRLLPDLLNPVASYDQDHGLLSRPTHDRLAQFILDCTSLNLPGDYRVSPRHPLYCHIARHCCQMTYAIHKDRIKQLTTLGFLR